MSELPSAGVFCQPCLAKSDAFGKQLFEHSQTVIKESDFTSNNANKECDNAVCSLSRDLFQVAAMSVVDKTGTQKNLSPCALRKYT